MIDALVKGAEESGGTENDMENLYAAVVGDNIAANLASAKIMEDQFPHVFNGCCSHCANLLCKAICKIPGIKPVLFVAKMVQHHANVKAAYKWIAVMKKKGIMSRLLPET